MVISNPAKPPLPLRNGDAVFRRAATRDLGRAQQSHNRIGDFAPFELALGLEARIHGRQIAKPHGGERMVKLDQDQAALCPGVKRALLQPQTMRREHEILRQKQNHDIAGLNRPKRGLAIV